MKRLQDKTALIATAAAGIGLVSASLFLAADDAAFIIRCQHRVDDGPATG